MVFLLPVVAAVIAIAVFVLWRGRRRDKAAQPEETVLPDELTALAPEEPEAPPVEGPGQLLIRYYSLVKELEETTKELQKFSGTREVQLQGWQQLSSDIIRRILPVLDNLEPYLDEPDSEATMVAQLAYGRLMTELVTVGVSQIIPAPGEPFNGKYHALSPESTGYPPFRIKSVVSPGFRFQPRITGATEIVLKPAEVIVESAVTAIPEDGDAVEVNPLPAPELDEVVEVERAPAPVLEEV